MRSNQKAMKFSASCLFGWPEKLSTTMKFPQKQSTLAKSIWNLFVCFYFLFFTRLSSSRRYVSVFLSNLFYSIRQENSSLSYTFPTNLFRFIFLISTTREWPHYLKKEKVSGLDWRANTCGIAGLKTSFDLRENDSDLLKTDFLNCI